MNIYKSLSGYWIISEIVKGYLVTKRFMGYNKRDSIKLFKRAIK